MFAVHEEREVRVLDEEDELLGVRADLKPDHLVTKRCPLLPWNSGVAAGVLVGPD